MAELDQTALPENFSAHCIRSLTTGGIIACVFMQAMDNWQQRMQRPPDVLDWHCGWCNRFERLRIDTNDGKDGHLEHRRQGLLHTQVTGLQTWPCYSEQGGLTLITAKSTGVYFGSLYDGFSGAGISTPENADFSSSCK